ncbi:MAG: hypothetical protein B5M51_00765 [Anaerolinea sp. 4484_236]|nr:MAG: hypothetical protein B5M51_00765 [Anaerolinea sp. 4484_236]
MKHKIMMLLLMFLFIPLAGCGAIDVHTGAEADAIQTVADAEATAIEMQAAEEARQLAIDREQARQLAAIKAEREREAAAVEHQINLILDIAEAKAKASMITAAGIVAMVLVSGVSIFGIYSGLYWLNKRQAIKRYEPRQRHVGQYLSYNPHTGIQIVQPDGVVKYLEARHVK